MPTSRNLKPLNLMCMALKNDSLDGRSSSKMDKMCRGPYRISSILKWVTEKNDTKRLIEKKNNDCFWMENIFWLESHIHLWSRHTSANPAYVIKTCLGWHAISKARYWGFVSPKLHVSTYRNQQHCWWFHEKHVNDSNDNIDEYGVEDENWWW